MGEAEQAASRHHRDRGRRRRTRSGSRARNLSASLLVTTLSAFAGIALALAGTGVSDALWSSQAEVPEIQVVAGTPGLEIALGNEPGEPGTAVVFPENTWVNMLPGDAVCSPVTLTNVGDVSLTLQARMDDLVGVPMTVQLAEGGCDTPGVPAVNLALGPAELAGALAPQASRTLGVIVSLNIDAPDTLQGQIVVPEFRVSVTGTT